MLSFIVIYNVFSNIKADVAYNLLLYSKITQLSTQCWWSTEGDMSVVYYLPVSLPFQSCLRWGFAE